MALIAIRQFRGEIPKTPPHLLPDGAAQQAVNCDFTAEALVPLRAHTTEYAQVEYPPIVPGAGGYPLALGNLIRSMFKQQDQYGVYKLVTWNTQYEKMYKSPVIDEIYDRFYTIVTHPYGPYNAPVIPIFAVFELANCGSNGGEPAFETGRHVGCPEPTVAPEIVTVDLTSEIPNVDDPQVEIKGWWEADNVRHQEATLSTSTNSGMSTFMREWTVTMAAPAITTDPETEEDTGVPSEVIFGAQVAIKDGDKVLCTLSSTAGATFPARSTAFPGGLELVVSKASTTATDYVFVLKLTWGIFETRAYTFTCINEWMEESAPSPATLVSLNYLQKVKLTCTYPSFVESIPGTTYYYKPRNTGSSGLDGIKVYRTFGSSPDYLSIKVGAGSTSDTGQGSSQTAVIYDDLHTPYNIGTALKSIGWRVPPREMRGLMQMPNGWFAAYKDNILYMSEPYRPHAWPYSMTFEKDIVGLQSGAQMLVVTTSDALYVVAGSHPAAVSQMRLPVPVGGVSQRSMCNVEGAVAVATYDGIVMVSGSSASLSFNQSLFTRQVWLSRYRSNLANMTLSYNDGFLIASFESADGFVVRTDEAAGMFSRLTTRMWCTARFPPEDGLVFCSANAEDSHLAIFRFCGSTDAYLPATWHSKEHTFVKPEAMGAGYMRTAGACTLTIYLNGTTYYQTAIGSGETHFRIPARRAPGDGLSPAVGAVVDGRGMRWSLKVETSVPVYELLVAQTMAELRGA